MADAYAGRVDFVLVYIREAHAADEWVKPYNTEANISVPQPGTFWQRCGVATKCAEALGIRMTTLVDDMDDSASRAYGAWPERLYVIDPDGAVGYQGGYGPFDFEPGEVAAYLAAKVGPAGEPEPNDEHRGG